MANDDTKQYKIFKIFVLTKFFIIMKIFAITVYTSQNKYVDA